MQSENCISSDAVSTDAVSTDAVKQQTSTQQGYRIRLALECMAGESLASRLRQKSQAALESASSLNSESSNSGNRDAGNAEADNYKASNCKANKHDTCKDELNFTRVDDIRRALYALCTRQDTDLAAQLELLVRFDDLEGWRESGAKSCAAWMNASLCIDRRTAWERLRVGRQLRLLPIIQRLFRNGRLSWSKVRLLTRIANPDNEQLLAHVSLDASVSDVQRLCEDYRWPVDEDETSDEGKAHQQYERRRLSWRQLPDGNTLIQLVLPPEKAQNFLHSIEHCEDLLYNDALDCQGSATETETETETEDTPADKDADYDNKSKPDDSTTATQRRADAAVLMAERSLAFRGDDLAPADRYQVVLNVDAGSLAQTAVALGASEQPSVSSETSTAHPAVPVRKPRIEGVGPVTLATARQISCDCSLFTLLSADGEPLSIGRKSRLWPASMRRAILTRDRHCQFTGCDSHRFLQIHHIKHWADGGETSIENGVSLCQHHHQLIHSGEFTIERATVVTPETENALTQGLFSSSKRRLLPSRCRFRVSRQHQHRRNLQQTSCEASNTQSANTPSINTYSANTQPANECRDGDLQWTKSYCNTSAGHIFSNTGTGTGTGTGNIRFSTSTASFDQRVNSVHSSHTLHVDTIDQRSNCLPVGASRSSAERLSKQFPSIARCDIYPCLLNSNC